MTIPGARATEESKDPYAVVKFFTPDAGWTWFVTEWEPESGVFFGLVEGLYTEFGTFSLQELTEARGPWGMRVERDLHFRPTRVRELKAYQREWGGRGPYDRTSAGEGG
ncbi:MAG: DUF2958 domain-containing protein [Anaerolineales bacterium]|nr:MAG: DUF2958 domain-containing protein [Anaerolineales bacterium]